MSASGSKASPSIGFLTVCEHEGQGVFGGYLLLNTTGRPLEFYCTAPVRPNRAQEILYGATLRPYLYGEQIGVALLEKAKAKPLLVFTDVEPALAVRGYVSYPVVYVPSRRDLSPSESQADRSAASPPPASAPLSGPALLANLHVFQIGELELAVAPAFDRDEKEVLTRWGEHAAEFDVHEPFQRIRDAIDEARRTAKSAA